MPPPASRDDASPVPVLGRNARRNYADATEWLGQGLAAAGQARAPARERWAAQEGERWTATQADQQDRSYDVRNAGYDGNDGERGYDMRSARYDRNDGERDLGRGDGRQVDHEAGEHRTWPVTTVDHGRQPAVRSRGGQLEPLGASRPEAAPPDGVSRIEPLVDDDRRT